MTGVSNHSNSLSLYSSRPGRPPKRASVGLSLAASHLAAAAGHHPQHSLKKHRMDNGDYYENGHLGKSRASFCRKRLQRSSRGGERNGQGCCLHASEIPIRLAPNGRARATRLITTIRVCTLAHGDPADQLIRGIKHTWSEQINCDCSVVLRPAVAVTGGARDIGVLRYPFT